MDAYWRAANYLSVGQIYLYDNPLLLEPLKLEHVKPRLLGHWGTTPGQNFIYVHLNRIIKQYALNMIYISGPGHGGPALVAHTYLEGIYSELYPNITEDAAGLKRLFKQFSFPGGIPSHVAPETPGSIHEGGELGYSLSHAFGAAFDNPDLIVAAVVGDGEAETGPLATSWHSNKFLDPVHDGAVLPILHLNGYKIANPTVLARIGREELEQLMRGYGYHPYFVEGDDPETMHPLMAATLDKVVADIRRIQNDARTKGITTRPHWPMIVFKSPKGWTGPKVVDGLPRRGNLSSSSSAALRAAEVSRASEDAGKLDAELSARRAVRQERPARARAEGAGSRRRAADGSQPARQWRSSLARTCGCPIFAITRSTSPSPGKVMGEDTRTLGKYLRDVIKLNADQRNFRIFGPTRRPPTD